MVWFQRGLISGRPGFSLGIAPVALRLAGGLILDDPGDALAIGCGTLVGFAAGGGFAFAGFFQGLGLKGSLLLRLHTGPFGHTFFARGSNGFPLGPLCGKFRLAERRAILLQTRLLRVGRCFKAIGEADIPSIRQMN